MTAATVRRFVVALALGAWTVLCLGWAEDSWRPEWDGALYILTGQALAAGEGYTYLDRPFFLRPPGLPWLISRVSGAGSFQAGPVNLLLMAFAAAATAAIAFALSRLHGAWLGLGAALLFAASPLVVGSFNFVLAEFPFLTFFYLGIGLLQIRAPRRGVGLAALAGAASLAASFHFRAPALLLVPGMLWLAAARADRGARWRALLPVVLLLALCAPWLHHARSAAAAAERPSDQLLLHDYATALVRVDPRDPDSAVVSPAGWAARVASNGASVLRDLARTTLAPGRADVGALLAALALLGWGLCVRRRPSLLEWFAAAYAGLLLIYFTSAPRLLIPLLPLVYLYLLVAAAALGRRLAGTARTLPWALPLALFATLATLDAVRLPRALDAVAGKPARAVAWRHTASLADWIRSHTPQDAVLLCNQAPVYAVLTGRRAYTYRFAEPEQMLVRYRPDFVLFDAPASASAAFEQRVAERAVRRWAAPAVPAGVRVYELPVR